MRICFLYESAFTLGGIQRCITMLSNYLVNKGYDVSIICTRTKVKEDRELYGLDNKVKVIFTNKKSILKKVIYRLLIFLKKLNHKFKFLHKETLNFIYSFLYKKDIEKILAEKSFDIVIGCGGFYTKLLSLIKNETIKKIGWQHSSYDRYFNVHFLNEDEIVQEMFENIDEYIVLTIDDKEKLKNLKKVETKVIYNPIGFKQENKSNLENKKFIALGRLNKLKGFDLLIDSFYEFNKKNKEWTLDIVGEGSEKESLEEQIKKLNLQKFVRVLPRTNKVKEVYQEASVYCMSSRAEGWGLVILEAMESGLPIISYDMPCIREIAQDDEVVIIENGNYKEYAEAMLELAERKDKRENLAKKSIEIAKRFSIENIGKQWEKLFEELESTK